MSVMNDKYYFYFVRHGQTQYNVLNLVQGQCDSPLTEKGKKQLQECKKILDNIDFKHAYVSDLKRTVDSSKILLKDRDIPITYTPLIREFALGEYEKTDNCKLVTKQINSVIGFEDKGGESIEQIKERMFLAMNKAREENEKGNILMVAHGGCISLLLHLIDREKIDKYLSDNTMGNASISIVSYDGSYHYEETIFNGFH